MLHETLVSAFADAALPQKVVLVALVGAIPLTIVAAAFSFRTGAGDGGWRRVIANLRFGGPGLGLLAAAMNSFHMAQTIQRLPFDATAKQLAPGILEVSLLAGLGALVGVVALAAHAALSMAPVRREAPETL